MKLSRCLVFLSAMLLGACGHHAPTQIPHTPSAADLEAKTIALVAVQGEEAQAYCSGVWVERDAILTAAHCTHDFEIGEAVAYVTRADLSPKDEDALATVRIGKLVARDDLHDLALLRVRLAPDHPIARVAEDVRVGEPTRTMGHPLGLWWSYSTGTVASVRRMALGDEAIWWVQTTAPTSPGNSGGGLFNEDGELLGICHAYFPKGQNLNIFVHAQYVSTFLKGAL